MLDFLSNPRSTSIACLPFFFRRRFQKAECCGKKKGCEKVALWVKSISNHMYWCAASSVDDPDLIVSKWRSITNHVANVHEGHEGRFDKCLHKDIEDRSWMKPGRC